MGESVAMKKKLIYQFYEIEVPDDFPDGFDGNNVKDYFSALKRYADEHPDVADKFIRDCREAYQKWIKSKEAPDAQNVRRHYNEKIDLPIL